MGIISFYQDVDRYTNFYDLVKNNLTYQNIQLCRIENFHGIVQCQDPNVRPFMLFMLTLKNINLFKWLATIFGCQMV